MIYLYYTMESFLYIYILVGGFNPSEKYLLIVMIIPNYSQYIMEK